MLPREGSEGSFDLMVVTTIQDEKLLSERTRRFGYVPNLHLADRLIGVYQ